MRGYNKIASFMSKYPESAIVSRFSELNIQNIIYLQAEIFGLQIDLKELENANDRSPDAGMNPYSSGLRSRRSSSPHPKHLAKFQEWMKRPSLGGVFLIGRDRNIWADGKDLVAIQEKVPENIFFELWANTITPIYHYSVGRFYKKPDIERTDYASNIVDYCDTVIFRIVSFFGVIMASILPVMTIVVLYLVASMVKRLALVGIFTTIFSVCLWFMTDGRLVEVFSATSAFAAVQVVFISTNITST
ncbi:uncharacterized protein EAF02_005622 [Botrytis sinoallii]|uniref:uncharacterized protein n=1 Tax=Botrytis sinoallii TaxID=1463999 RepID=UPI0018FFFFB8|nr:uncharacterized protein EAF02_005622 [Botrytis sinoallii]KAF7883702.1 hypothetical protein EAF02_005622 [Botrytis sinoallii]